MNFQTVAILRKILFIFVWYVFYPNLFFIIFIPEIYSNINFLVTIVMLYFFGALDTIVRPFSKNEKFDKFSLLLLIFFFLGPILAIGAFVEYTKLIKNSFVFYDSILLVVIGNLLILGGGLITIIARLQIGRFGSGILTIEPDHQLKTDGLFKYIRHPIYLGSLLQGFGFYLAFRTIFMLLFTTIAFFLLFNNRASYEEIILEQHFQDEYRAYKGKTRKFIPFFF